MKDPKMTKIDNRQGRAKSLDSKATISLNANLQSNVEVNEPWLSVSGNELTLESLRIVSKNWDQETWERYLKYLETPLREKPVSRVRFQRASESFSESVFTFAGSGSHLESSKLFYLLEGLTKRQRDVIELIYWRNMSHREVACALGIYQSTVGEIKASAIKRMSEMTKMDPVTLPICIEPVKTDEPKEDQDAKHSA